MVSLQFSFIFSSVRNTISSRKQTIQLLLIHFRAKQIFGFSMRTTTETIFVFQIFVRFHYMHKFEYLDLENKIPLSHKIQIVS